MFEFTVNVGYFFKVIHNHNENSAHSFKHHRMEIFIIHSFESTFETQPIHSIINTTEIQLIHSIFFLCKFLIIRSFKITVEIQLAHSIIITMATELFHSIIITLATELIHSIIITMATGLIHSIIITMATAAHSCNHNGNCSSFMQSLSQWQLQLIHAIFLMLHIFSVWCTTAHISYRVYTWKHFVYCSGEGPMMWVKEREWVCGHRKYHSIYIENCIITMHKYRCVVFYQQDCWT